MNALWGLLFAMSIPILCLAEDDTDYRQRERVVTWPVKWQQDLAQCQGAAISVRTLRAHVCALHQRCEADTYDDDVQACLKERGYEVRTLTL